MRRAGGQLERDIVRKLLAAACLLAALAISLIVTGAKPPGGGGLSPVCSSDSCALKGAVLADASATSDATPSRLEAVPNETPVPEKPAVQIADASNEPVAPDVAPAELATLSPEPLAEPEPPPTVAAEPMPWIGRWRPITVSFAYLNSHPVRPLAASTLEPTAPAEPWSDVTGATPAAMPLDAQVGASRAATTRLGLCSTIVSAARGNDLPIPFFANLIWQESNFRLGEISDAGALGVAQFISETANEHGLTNPFEPVHAIYTAGRFLRKLYDQYGNLGYAAAAYNSGPGRVNDWIAKRRALPGETRAYVNIITGHHAAQWASATFRHDLESTLMPAKAPCPEVAQAVAVQAKIVRVARLMQELAAATVPPLPSSPPLPRPNPLRIHSAPADQIAKVTPKDQSTPAGEATLLERIAARAKASDPASRHDLAANASHPAAPAHAAVEAQAKTQTKPHAKAEAPTKSQAKPKAQASVRSHKPNAKTRTAKLASR